MKTPKPSTLLALFAALVILTPSEAQAMGQLVRPFTGIGLTGNYHLNAEGSDGGLYLSGRMGELGLIGYGVVGDLGYRFSDQDVYGRVGVDAFLAILGVRLDVAWKTGFSGDTALGLAYSSEVVLPLPTPVFFHIGGQSFNNGTHEFFTGLSVYLPVGGDFIW